MLSIPVLVVFLFLVNALGKLRMSHCSFIMCDRQGNDVDVRQQVCPKDSFAILPEKCRCVDQQTLKLQESHDMIPVGELPRQVLLTVDR